jgi:hypothetical protein
MAATKAHSKKNRSVLMVDKNMKTYANDPFFVNKANRANALIGKYGLPKNHGNKGRNQRGGRPNPG